jgi:hypothetical protein
MNQAYNITMTKKDYYYPCYLNAPLQNFMLQLQMQISSGDAGGVVFRDDNRRPDFYYLYMTATGVYSLDYWADERGSNVQTLLRGISDDFYQKQIDGRFCIVTLVAQGPNLSLYINEKYVGAVQDNRIGGGRIALTAQKFLNDTQVIYKNVQIWTL